MRKTRIVESARQTSRLALAGILAVTVIMLTATRAPAQTRTANRTTSQSNRQHPLAPAINLARTSLKSMQNVRDYEANFHKREWIDGELLSQSTNMKLRQQPFSVYLSFQAPNEGREVVYNQGRNDGKLLVHDAGIKSIVGTISLDPTSSWAMEESRYPITLIGMSNLARKVLEQWRADMRYSDVQVRYYPNAKLGNRECKVVQTSHPRPRPHVTFHMTRLYIDRQTNFPVRVEQYGFPQRPGQKPPLLEEYTYSNVKANVGLNDRDFDVENPNYNF